MTDELEPVWRQLGETYDAVRLALSEVPDDRLHWRPGSQANTVAGIVQHIARANILYADMMVEGIPGERWDLEESPSRERLLERLAESEGRMKQIFECMTVESLRRKCADDWNPLGPEVRGPLDARWFAMQMVRHSAYHLGQINVYHLLLPGEEVR